MLKSDIAFQLPNDEIVPGKGEKTAFVGWLYTNPTLFKKILVTKKKLPWPLGLGVLGVFGKFHPHPNLWYGFMNPHSLRYHGPPRKKKNTRVASVLSDDLWLSSQRTDLHLFSSRAAMVQWHGEKESFCCGCIYNWRYIIHLHEKSMCIYLICVYV